MILVYIEDHPKTIMLLRTARRRAEEKGCGWRVAYVETPAQAGPYAEDGAHERMLRLLTLAAQMGAETIHLEAESVEAGLRKLLEGEQERIALCMVGSTEPDNKWRRPWRRSSSWQRVVQLVSKHAPMEIIPLAGQPFMRSLWPRPHLRLVRLRHLVYALLAVLVAFGCAALLQWALPPALFRINSRNVAMIFMIACAFVSGRYGLVPGLLAAVTGFFAANYYFIPPYRAMPMASVTEGLDMALFLCAAVLVAVFTSQARSYAEQVAKRELSTQALFALYRIAANSFTRSQALEKLQRKLSRMMEMEVAFFLPPMINPDAIEPSCPADLVLGENDRKALDACWKEMKTTGLASPFNPGTEWRFEPMLAPGGEIGVLAIRPRNGRRLDSWYGRLLTAIADQTAAVLEHIELERFMEATRIREEREKLRSLLLSSVSHDLKTPLAGIIGALSVFQSLGDRLPPARRDDLMETALEEAHRLDNFITNILDMTRLESGKVEFHSEWHNIQDLIQQVVKRLQHRLRRHKLTVHTLPENTEVCMDVMMTEQVLQNLLDNACKYTPAGTEIEISCAAGEQGVIINVRDHGKGLPSDKLERAFDKYARLQKEDSQIAGTGLGLSICKAVMEMQKGWISAANHPEGGAVFTLCLPQWRKAETAKHVA